MPPIPPITQFLMLACTAVFCVQQLVSLAFLVLFPISSGAFLPWQPFTYAFLHTGVFHLFFNMLALWMFGAELEMLWGRKRYMAFLLVSGLCGALLYLVMTAFVRGAPLVGFSGVIYGLLMATAVLFPDRTIMPIFPPIPMKMKVFAVVFAAILLLTSWNDVSAMAHLGGALGGWLVIRYWRGLAPFSKRRR
jgi:membrane associated rhomboid family serine protease